MRSQISKIKESVILKKNGTQIKGNNAEILKIENYREKKFPINV